MSKLEEIMSKLIEKKCQILNLLISIWNANSLQQHALKHSYRYHADIQNISQETSSPPQGNIADEWTAISMGDSKNHHEQNKFPKNSTTIFIGHEFDPVVISTIYFTPKQ